MTTPVALVSGSTRGIGKAIALGLAKQGYHVYITGRTAADLEKCLSEIRALKGQATALELDLTQVEQIQKAVKVIQDKEQALHVLVTNIGSGKSVKGWDVSTEEWQRVFNINF